MSRRTAFSSIPPRFNCCFYRWWSQPSSQCNYFLFVFLVAGSLFVVLLRRPTILLLQPENNPRSVQRRHNTLSYESLQRCVDEYTSKGAWNGSKWTVPRHPDFCGFQTLSNHQELAAAFSSTVKVVGFMGDSTTRSDLRGWEETFQCPRTNLDEIQVFQILNEEGDYLCLPEEQSFNLTKCGIPPIVEVTNCPPTSGIAFRYFYKIYPWTPLDRWFLEQPHLFRDLDVLVISIGRWFVYLDWTGRFNITEQFDHFLVELQKVYKGVILFQSEYPKHTSRSDQIQFPVACTPHATCSDCSDGDTGEPWECAPLDNTKRPERDVELRSVLERHHILYLDRWNVSRSLPLEYYQSWYCHNGTVYQWDCSHHLGLVAIQHMRLIANVIVNLFVSKQVGKQ